MTIYKIKIKNKLIIQKDIKNNSFVCAACH